MRWRNIRAAIVAGVTAFRATFAGTASPAPSAPTPNEKPRVKDAKTGSPSYLAGMDIFPFNPDDLVRFKGKRLQIYQDMMKEPHVKAAFTLKLAQAIGEGGKVAAKTKQPIDVEVADWVKWNLENVTGDFRHDLWQIGGSTKTGHSLSEKIVTLFRDGPWAGRIGFREFRSIDPNAFEFVVDEFRGIKGVTDASNPNLTAPEYTIDQFVHMAWMGDYEDPHGTSDFRAAHRASWLYDVVSKLRARYVEKFAVPWVIGTMQGTPGTEEEDQFWASVLSLQEDACMLLFDGQTVDIKQAVTDQQSFETLQARLANEILISILGSHLAIAEGQLNGAKAASETHGSTTDIMVSLLRYAIEVVVREQIIRPLVLWNYPTGTELPTFSLAGETRRGKEELEAEKMEIENDKTLGEVFGVKFGEMQQQEKYKRPLPEEDDVLVDFKKSAPPSPFGLPGMAATPPKAPAADQGNQGDQQATLETETDNADPTAETMASGLDLEEFAEKIGVGLPEVSRRAILRNLQNEEIGARIAAQNFQARIAAYRQQRMRDIQKKSPSRRCAA